MGGLIADRNFILLNNMSIEKTLYKFDYPKNINIAFDIIGEGNSDNADLYSFMIFHNKGLSIAKSAGPKLIKIYRDSEYNYYLYMPAYSRALIYFTNRVSMGYTISATKVDTDISTLTQVGI